MHSLFFSVERSKDAKLRSGLLKIHREMKIDGEEDDKRKACE